MLVYFVCSSWCGVEVRINGCGSEGGVLGVPPPSLGFGGGGRCSDFLAGRCLICIVSVYICFSIVGGEYRCFSHPRRFPVDVKLYREDWGVFIFRVCFVECVGFQPVVYTLAELLGSEGFCFPTINAVDSIVKEMFVVVDCYYVKWCGSGMLW